MVLSSSGMERRVEMLVAKGVFVELGEDGEFEDLGLRVWGE